MNQNKNTSLLFKFIAVAAVAAALAVMWQYKNKSTGALTEAGDDFSLNVTEQINLESLKSHNLPIIIDFGSDSCIPCREMAPTLEKLNRELHGKAVIRFADVWKSSSLADGFPVRVIPTQILIDSSGEPYTPNSGDPVPLKTYQDPKTGEHIFTAHEGGITEADLMTMLKNMGME